MDFKLEAADYQQQISHYQTGCVTISGQQYHDNLVLTPEHIVTEALPAQIEELSTDDIDALLSSQPEVILIGTGERAYFLSPKLHQHAAKRGYALEVMQTPAACRTFSVLASEQRKVIAALFL